ncbi:OmpA family protein [Aquimarina sp. W85]|uniref:OmpA family protein n=1 Tax=Aquimarina rhodophyticola TaxID=3342246 RepID=UPI003670E590
MTSKIETIVIIALILTCNLFGQEKQLAKADEKFSRYAYVDARQIYLNVAKKGYSSASLYKKLGDSYYFNGDLKNSVTWYEKLYESYKDDMGTDYLFRYSQGLKSIKRYEDSDRVMELFRELINFDKRADFFTNAEDYLKFIDLQSGKFNMSNLAINSKFSDHAPSFNYNEELVFASSREGGKMTKSVHKWNNMPFLDLYVSQISNDPDTLSKPRKLKGEANTKFHESTTSFTSDGKTVYFTRNNYTNNIKGADANGTMLLKLYRAQINGSVWENIEELPFNSDEYSVAHPTINREGTQLYFVSDMPGTVGLSDIFVVDVYEDGSFGTPINLGDNINTEGRETYPFISENGELYFSSDGHMGLGGLDVFISVKEEASFKRPFNVGRPINSTEDDFGFIINPETKKGFLSSNREGGLGKDDVYSFEQTGKLITSCTQYVKGKVYDDKTNALLTGATVILLTEENVEVDRMLSDAAGVYRFENLDCDRAYIVRIEQEGYSAQETVFRTTSVLEQEKELSPIRTRKIEKEVMVTEGDDLNDILDLEPIHFDFDDYLIRDDAKVELAKVIEVMQQNPTMKIEIRSHTDSRASADYNLKLSARRAKKTENYIAIIGQIDRSRIAYKGFGEEQLLNDCVTGAECSDEEHEKNRRSEFIVIEN